MKLDCQKGLKVDGLAKVDSPEIKEWTFHMAQTRRSLDIKMNSAIG